MLFFSLISGTLKLGELDNIVTFLKFEKKRKLFLDRPGVVYTNIYV